MIERSFSQGQYAQLWMSYNHLCMQMLALAYLAGEFELARAFQLGVNTAAKMSMLHMALIP